ncbi:MAG: hypothetical protein DRZ79_01975 [Candidatus Cloacimonadota bacterium]|nr:MAG: hypothetical protein DRZ79_01975 [Candidatus Cloacimonadota bacterium]
MRKIIWGGFLLTILLFFGCAKLTSTQDMENENNGRVIGTIHGVVFDANTNEFLANISISWSVNGKIKTTTTNSVGYYSITNLSPGNYELTFYGSDNYAVAYADVQIPTLDQIGIDDIPTEEDFYFTVNDDIFLFGKTSGVEGTVYKIIDNETIEPAEGVTVIADFRDYDISPAEYTVETDADGHYLFTNLPATPDVHIRTLPFSDGTYSFDLLEIDINLLPNTVLNAPNMFVQIHPDIPFIVANNYENDNFGIFDALEITFNKAIDPLLFEVNLYSNQNDPVEFESIVWNSETNVTITPDEDLLLDTNYNLDLEGFSTDGNHFFINQMFTTQPGIDIENTNLEVYDNHYEIDANGTIIINFTEAVDIDNGNNVLTITNYDDPAVVWSEGNKTLSIAYPTGGYTNDFVLHIKYYSTLASYDFVEKVFNVELSE